MCEQPCKNPKDKKKHTIQNVSVLRNLMFFFLLLIFFFLLKFKIKLRAFVENVKYNIKSQEFMLYFRRKETHNIFAMLQIPMFLRLIGFEELPVSYCHFLCSESRIFTDTL